MQETSPAVVRTSTAEPSGRATSTSTSGPEPKKSRRGRPVERIASSPAAKWTTVFSAAATSAELRGFRGRTATTVSDRAEARTVTEPDETSMRAEMGCGVSNVGMAVPSSGQGWVPRAGRPGSEVRVRDGRRLARPPRVLGAAGPAAAPGLGRRPRAGVHGVGDGPDQPGVDREAEARRRLVDAGLELLGQPQRDARASRPPRRRVPAISAASAAAGSSAAASRRPAAGR